MRHENHVGNHGFLNFMLEVRGPVGSTQINPNRSISKASTVEDVAWQNSSPPNLHVFSSLFCSF